MGRYECFRVGIMKRKTSVSIDARTLAILKREAKKQDRSVSYILEKFLQEKAAAIVAETPPIYGTATRPKSPPKK